jgi:hypothetical protein
MRTSTPLLIATLSLLSRATHAQPWQARVVARTPGAPRYETDPVQARVGEPVELAVVLVGARGVVLGDAPRVRLDGRAVTPRAPLPAGATVTWIQVEPRRGHAEFPSPNASTTSFSNAVLFGPNHGRWRGYDRLEYTQHPVAPGPDAHTEGNVLRVSAAHPEDRAHDTHAGAGSSWFAARVHLPDGGEVSTPDATRVERMGLSPTVMRVSFRADDTYVGWLSTYFHVTSVFGSNGPTATLHQSDRYTGADCADVLVGALRASGRRELPYGSVASIGTYARPLTGVLRIDEGGLRDASGEAVALRWGVDVRPGDLVTIDYADDPGQSLPRAWDHIGALVGDAPPPSPDGVLSPGDTLRHMGAHGLEDTALVHGGPMRIVLWRWRDAPSVTRVRAGAPGRGAWQAALRRRGRPRPEGASR